MQSSRSEEGRSFECSCEEGELVANHAYSDSSPHQRATGRDIPPARFNSRREAKDYNNTVTRPSMRFSLPSCLHRVFRESPRLPFLCPFLLRTKRGLAGRLARVFGEKRMREDGKAKLQRNLRHAVVQTWMISTAAVLVAVIPVDHARGGELMDCEPQRVRGDGRHWAYRIIDGRECWYPGERGKPKDELRWTEVPSATQESGVLEQPDVEARPPAPAPQRPGVVEQAEVEASPPEPTLDPTAASPGARHHQADAGGVARGRRRSVARFHLLLAGAADGRLGPAAWARRKAGPAASLAADPAAAGTLRDVVKEAQAAACSRFWSVISVVLVALVASCGPPGRSLCERRAQGPTAGRRQLTHLCSTPNQAGPHRRRFGASCSSRSSTGISRIAGFLPQPSQGWRLASDEVHPD